MAVVLQTRAERIGKVRAANLVPTQFVSSISMKKLSQSPAQETAPTSPTGDAHNGAPNNWQDGSGEGAASALDSLRKLEQHRSRGQPQDDRQQASR